MEYLRRTLQTMIMQMLYSMQKTQKTQKDKKLVFQNNRQKIQIYINPY